MTIIEALTLSKKNGRAYMRVRGGAGFVQWAEGYTYRLTTEDLLADNWEDVATGIPKLTGGRWSAAEPGPSPEPSRNATDTGIIELRLDDEVFSADGAR